MVTNVRRGVFETNSSSMHSLTLSQDNRKEWNHVMRVCFGEFGWGYDVLASPQEKTSYIVTSYLHNVINVYKTDNVLEALSEFQFIQDLFAAISNHTGQEVVFEDSSDILITYRYGYVDHQSIDLLYDYFGFNYTNQVFEENVDPDRIRELVDIIFNSSVIIIDNDNH